MAQLQSEMVDVDENFDLKAYLAAQKFTQYSKIETAIDSGDLTLDDILGCNEQELKEVLIEFEISSIQRNRFVNAIKKLPKSKMNQNNGGDDVSSTPVGAIQLLTTEQQNTINRFSDISAYLQQIIRYGKHLKQRNDIVLKQAQDKVWSSFFFLCFLLLLIIILFVFVFVILLLLIVNRNI